MWLSFFSSDGDSATLSQRRVQANLVIEKDGADPDSAITDGQLTVVVERQIINPRNQPEDRQQ